MPLAHRALQALLPATMDFAEGGAPVGSCAVKLGVFLHNSYRVTCGYRLSSLWIHSQSGAISALDLTGKAGPNTRCPSSVSDRLFASDPSMPVARTARQIFRECPDRHDRARQRPHAQIRKIAQSAYRSISSRRRVLGKRPAETLLPNAGSRRDFDLLGHGACEIPRKELVDLVDGMIGDACEHFPQVRFRIQPIELGRADQAVERGGSLAASI